MDVAIIGGGPNGLLLATELALAGVRPVVLERLPERATAPKANGLVGRVVPALHRRGLYATLSGQDRPPAPVPAFQFGALPLALAALEDNPMYILPIPQRRLEELLEERARGLGVEIRRGHELVGLGQTGDQVTAEIAGPEGRYTLAVPYLVGADGGRSTVRKACGIGFPGITDRGFVGRSGQVVIHPPVAVPGTGELEVPGAGRFRPATFTRTERGMFAYGMFRPGLYRVSVHEWAPSAQDGERDEDTSMPLEELRDAVRRVLGGDVPMSEPDGEPSVLRRTTGLNSRQASRYQAGRVFLVGDAAHVHSGVGGPGLNLGMQDVLNLGWKLAARIKGWAPEGLLGTYESERRAAGARVITHTRAQHALLSPGPNVTALREVFGALLEDPANVRRIAELMTGADVRYAGGPHPLIGRWMPDLDLRTDAGPATVAGLLHDARPVLLTFAGHAEHAATATPWSDRVDVVAAAGDGPAEAVLIRPDGYVAWAGRSGDGLEEALSTWFGRAAQRQGSRP